MMTKICGSAVSGTLFFWPSWLFFGLPFLAGISLVHEMQIFTQAHPFVMGVATGLAV